MLTNKAVVALATLGTLSDTTLKKKLGADLYKVLQEPEVKLAIQETKLKQAPAPHLTEEQKAALPPGILKLIQVLGPILLKLLLDRLGIKQPL